MWQEGETLPCRAQHVRDYIPLAHVWQRNALLLIVTQVQANVVQAIKARPKDDAKPAAPAASSPQGTCLNLDDGIGSPELCW